MVSCLGKTPYLFAGRKAGNALKIHIAAEECVTHQRVFGAEDDSVVRRIDLRDECGITQSDAKTFPLTDGVLIDALVTAEDIAFKIDKIAFGGNGLIGILTYEIGITALCIMLALSPNSAISASELTGK